MRYYDVEIVIIENLTAEQKNSENWPIQVNLTQPEKIVQLGQPALSEWLPKDVDLKSNFKILNSSHYQLTSEVEKISESKTQRVIFHTAWRQPGLDKNRALPVYFKRSIPAPPAIESSSEETTSDNIQGTETVLEGILRVTLARYLHLEAELTLQNKLPADITSDNPFAALDNENERERIQKQGVIHLKQKRRRMRSNELHYLDHPALSILVKIMPYLKDEDITTVKTKK